ncbi:class I SAM-dependent methyltransferase [Nocardiopsis sp. HNM0947]|uniref:Class I SAM-dependent methyltransferase n=1 Tax=Nocardiopsis coralli TaxID=2772213 RepID=A0ABR9PF30_9ACTN|nr:class I SAM-dependent methyltransferase [Nocardiopsis coralli]MBE3002437.1 class I SAM-dependent methyltransferase [Nocardiopsis coralli]
MRTLRRRLLPLLLASASVGAVMVLLPPALAAFGLLPWSQALILSGVILLGAAACALAGGLLLVRRSVRQLATEVRTHTRAVTEAVAAERLEIAEANADLEQVRAGLERIEGEVLPKQRRQFKRDLLDQGRKDYEQQVAWSELREHLDTATFMPPLRGWAASPDLVRLIVRHIDRLRPELVVECGSGSSSIWMGYALRRQGRGRVVAIEHDAHYAEQTRALIAEHGLDDVVEVRLAPLVEAEPGTVTDTGLRDKGAVPRWYDTSAFADLDDIGLLLVDGPPESTGRQARYPALPAFWPYLADDAVIILDDTSRKDERALGRRWLEEYPELLRVEEPAEKGAHVFSRKGA